MKKILLSLLLIAPLVAFSQSEASTERFIRIMGLAEKVLQADAVKLEFTLTEIQANEYQKILPKSIEDIESEFTTALNEIGIDGNLIVEDKIKNITSSKYSKTASKNYYIELPNEDEANKLAKLAVNGYNVSNVEYIYKDNYEDFIADMSIMAIKDARRKAENVARSAGKSVGDILNIEDMSSLSSASGSKYSNKKRSKRMLYKVNVTFELN